MQTELISKITNKKKDQALVNFTKYLVNVLKFTKYLVKVHKFTKYF